MKTQKEYISNKGKTCPNCNSNKIYGYGDTVLANDEFTVSKKAKCPICKATWVDQWHVELIGFINMEKGE